VSNDLLDARVLMSAYTCDPHRGSEPGNGWNWAQHMAPRVRGLTLLTPTSNRPGVSQYADQVPGLSIEFVAMPSWISHLPGHLRTYGSYLIWQKRSLARARELLAHSRFDLVHHTTWGGLYFGSSMRKLNLPFVFGPVGGGQTIPSGLVPVLPPLARLSEAGRAWAYCRATRLHPSARWTVEGASDVVASSQAAADAVRALGGRRVHLMVPDALAKVTVVSDAMNRAMSAGLNLVWLGRALPIKGLTLAIEVFASVLNRVPGATLTVVGSGSSVSVARRRAAQLGVADRVTFLGHVPWRDAQRILASADVFLFTSLRDTFGAQVIEALGYGVPTVAFAHHGIGDHCPDGALHKIYPTTASQSVADMADAVVEIAEDPALRASMSSCAVEWALRHTWNEHADQMRRIYALACEGSSSAS
jgi:glycosyltransferase involved in cell wall biosynthesis